MLVLLAVVVLFFVIRINNNKNLILLKFHISPLYPVYTHLLQTEGYIFSIFVFYRFIGISQENITWVSRANYMFHNWVLLLLKLFMVQGFSRSNLRFLMRFWVNKKGKQGRICTKNLLIVISKCKKKKSHYWVPQDVKRAPYCYKMLGMKQPFLSNFSTFVWHKLQLQWGWNIVWHLITFWAFFFFNTTSNTKEFDYRLFPGIRELRVALGETFAL